jgi:site-specific recombinase XerC
LNETGEDLNSELLLFTAKDGKPLAPDALTDLITHAMRATTNDPLVHPHLLRHSFASLNDLSLRSVDYPSAARLFEFLSLTRARLRQGAKLRSALTGAEAGPVRSCGHAIARLLGHSHCGTSWECYCHLHDILRYGLCVSVTPRYTATEYVHLSGLPKSSASEILGPKRDVLALLVALRKRHQDKFNVAKQVDPQKPKRGRPKNEGLPLPLDMIRVILARSLDGETRLDHIADDLPCNSVQVSEVLKLSEMHGKNIGRLFLPGNDSKPLSLGHRKDKEFARLLESALENLARKNFELLEKGCHLFVKHFNFTKDDVVFHGEKDLDKAAIFLRFRLPDRR